MPSVHGETRLKRALRLRRCKRRDVVLLLAIALFFHVVGRHIVRSAFEHIYTPPALTQDKLSVFGQLVRLAERHPEHPDIFLNMRGDIRFGMAPYSANVPEDLKRIERDTRLTPEECDALSMVLRGMKHVGCLYAYVKSPFVVFVPMRNYLLPTSPGVVYSLDGSNPNDGDADFLEGKRPFVLVKDGWYSRARSDRR